jgi:hypothetical protein
LAEDSFSDSSEEKFRRALREMLARGQYPDKGALRSAMGKDSTSRSGLTASQNRWRIQELERAGYDWQASKAKRQLVKAERRP